jgi:hypothetical protein
MKSINILILIIFANLEIWCQVISKNDLPHLVACVKLQNYDTTDNKYIVGNIFESYFIEPVDTLLMKCEYLQSKFNGVSYDKYLFISPNKYINRNNKDMGCLKIPYSDNLLIIFKDLVGHERRYDVLTLWKDLGDSIQFIALNHKPFMGGISRTYFEDYYFKDKYNSIIIFRNDGHDGGESWGELIITKYIPPCSLYVLNQIPYRSDIWLTGKIKSTENNIIAEINKKTVGNWWNENYKILKDTTLLYKYKITNKANYK